MFGSELAYNRRMPVKSRQTFLKYFSKLTLFDEFNKQPKGYNF
jgi:hypothetical protein